MTRSSPSVWARKSSKPQWWKRPRRMSTGWSNASCGLFSQNFHQNISLYFVSSGIPDKGNKAEITLTVLHRNFLGVDEFLGRVSLPLSGFDHQEKARSKYEVSLLCFVMFYPELSRWYPLLCKPGQGKSDYRGELEVKVEFKINAR